MSAQLTGAVEYTDCISAKGVRTPPNECPINAIKQCDGENPALEIWAI